MTLLVDIACPDCGRKRPVRKRGLGRYYCADCDREFTQAEVASVSDLSRYSNDDSMAAPNRERTSTEEDTE